MISPAPSGAFFVAHKEVAGIRNRYELSADGLFYRIFFRDGGFFLIDAADFPLVSSFSTWRVACGGYVAGNISRRVTRGNRMILLHMLLLGPHTGQDVDHINGDRMDNRRQNLRLCTHQENCFNQRKKITNTSGYTGVSYSKRSSRYEAYIHRDARKIYLGLYATPEAAARVRDQAALRYHGEYARLNFAD